MGADYPLLAPRQVCVVDLRHGCIGAACVDIMAFAMKGAPEPEKLLRRHAAVMHTGPGAITALLTALAGYPTPE